jgi:hypothetical protein
VADGPRSDEHGQALAAAAQLHATGDSAGALALLPDLVAARPGDLQVRLLLARCLAVAGEPTVALAAADAAVDCDPTSWAAHALVARAAMAIEPERAEAAAVTAVDLAPGEPEAHTVLAAVRAARTERAAAAEATPSGIGGRLGAAIGRKPGAPAETPAPTPAVPAEDPDRPRVEPRLPLALAGQPVPATAEPAAPTAPSPPTTPATPIAPTAPAAPPAPAVATGTERVEARLPKALGGIGLDEPGTGPAGDTADGIGGGRLVLRAFGLLLWVAFAFRYLVQVVGGPVGILLFLVALAGLGWVASRIRDL